MCRGALHVGYALTAMHSGIRLKPPERQGQGPATKQVPLQAALGGTAEGGLVMVRFDSCCASVAYAVATLQ